MQRSDQFRAVQLFDVNPGPAMQAFVGHAKVFSSTHLRDCLHEYTAGALGFTDAAGPGTIFV